MNKIPELFQLTDRSIDNNESEPKTSKQRKRKAQPNKITIGDTATTTTKGRKRKTKNLENIENLPVVEEVKAPPAAAAAASSKKATNVKLLKRINENDVIITDNTNNKKLKAKAFTSTPTGLRRRTLKAPNNVSMIINNE